MRSNPGDGLLFPFQERRFPNPIIDESRLAGYTSANVNIPAAEMMNKVNCGRVISDSSQVQRQ